MTARLHEVALTPKEIDSILAVCGPKALLVGGQALAFWANYFNVEPVGELSAKVTTDADFIGSALVAGELLAVLGRDWDMRTATLDDATGQVAKVYARVPGGGVKQVDFLSGIAGMDTRRIRAHALIVDLPSGAQIRVLHPLDVLESRLRNLQILPSKRNASGVAQARLAIDVARRFLESILDRGESARVLHREVNRVIALGLESRLSLVLMEYHLDVLVAVPVARIASPDFRSRRWPKVLDAVAGLRRKHEARIARRLMIASKRRS